MPHEPRGAWRLTPSEPYLVLRDFRVYFSKRRGFLDALRRSDPGHVRAVDGGDMEIREGGPRADPARGHPPIRRGPRERGSGKPGRPAAPVVPELPGGGRVAARG